MYFAVRVRFSRFYQRQKEIPKQMILVWLTLYYIGVVYPNGFSHKPVLQLKGVFAFGVFRLRNCLSNDAYDMPHKELVSSCGFGPVCWISLIYEHDILRDKAISGITFILIRDHFVTNPLECKCL